LFDPLSDTAVGVVRHSNIKHRMSALGQKADIARGQLNVRFTPKSGHWLSVWECPLCAKSGLMQCSKQHGHSTASSARVAPVEF